MLGVGNPPEPRCKLRHHSDCGHVIWVGPEALAKDRLGGGKIVCNQCSAGPD
jgi:hypothetical protein